jgi:hypothetical protein
MDKKRPRKEQCGKGESGEETTAFAGKMPLVLPRLRSRGGSICMWGSLNNQEHPVVRSAKANCAVIAILINSGFVDAPRSLDEPGFRL